MSGQDATPAGGSLKDERTCAFPGDQEHDHGMCEDAAADAARQARASEFASGLRSLAAMLEENPELVDDAAYLASTNAFYASNAKRLAAIAKTALRYGAKVDKQLSESQHNLEIRWGAFGVKALASRADVCERVVTGTRVVTKTVKDPEALAAVPEIEVTETVEDVEWKCRPLLATESTVGGA